MCLVSLSAYLVICLFACLHILSALDCVLMYIHAYYVCIYIHTYVHVLAATY